MISLLITGTDTGVGKTWVGRALSHALVAAGRRIIAIKPVETGCRAPARIWKTARCSPRHRPGRAPGRPVPVRGARGAGPGRGA